MELKFKSLKMEQLGDKLKGDTAFKLQTAAYECDLKTLALLIKTFSDDVNNDQKAFDIIDELIDGGKTIQDIYTEIFEGINEKGFFIQRLEVSEMPPINLKSLTAEMADKISKEMMKKQIGESLSENQDQSLIAAE